MDEDRTQLIAELKQAAFTLAFVETLMARPEEEIVDALQLLKPYSLCSQDAPDVFLFEIVRPLVEQGQKEALTELRRQQDAADAVRKQAEAVKEERAELEAAWKEVNDHKEAVRRGLGILKEREERVEKFEDLDVEWNRLQKKQADAHLECMRLREEVEQEKERAQRQIDEKKAQLAAEAARQREELSARAERLASREAGFRRQRLKVFWLKTAAIAFFASLLILPARDEFVRPYLDARQRFQQEMAELEERKQELTRAEKEVRGLHEQLAGRESYLNGLENSLDDRESQLLQQQTRLRDEERTFHENVRRAWEEIESRRRLLRQQASELSSRESQVRQQEASWKGREENRAFSVTLRNDNPASVYAEVVLGGTPVRFNGQGSRTLLMKKGRYSYSVRSTVRCWNGFALVQQEWFGSGVIEIAEDTQELSIAGEYPRLWLAKF